MILVINTSSYEITRFQHQKKQTARFLGSIGDGHFNLYAGFNIDGGDLLHDLGGTVQVDDSLVDPHLKLVPGLATLSARSLTGGDSQGLGGHPDGSLHLQLLVFGSLDEVTADFLQRFHVAGGQGDPDTVDGSVLLHTFSILISRHLGRVSVIWLDRNIHTSAEP